MTLATNTRFNSYLIGEPIGAGGMGEVYRATDTRLKRDVAIKVLPESFAADAERLARFQREAELLASLNHANIGQIYGIETANGITALVMELIEGPTLADRIAQGPVPTDEALNIGMQICAALEAAHDKGIVHRDLKPPNIKLASSGVVKVLDFGIAKALDPKTISGPHPAQLTTPAMTEAGIVLGTAAYMSPEQARGKPVDQRADIWAFGCVLYEMLTGQSAFGAEDVTTTLARILERGADMNALPAALSADVRQTLKLCLQKDPKKRVADIRDVKLLLAGAFELDAPRSAKAGTAPAGSRLGWAAFAVALAVSAALAFPALQHLRETPLLPPPETRVEINTPATNSPLDFALSPDGRQLVFVSSAAGEQGLWLRSLAATTAQPLAGTGGASRPFWSPDGRSIGFFTADALQKLELAGGAVQTLAPVLSTRGGAWSVDGTILFTPRVNWPMMQVPAGGGPVTAATSLGPQQLEHFSPYFLPDGQRFLFRVSGTPDTAGIHLGKLDGSTPVRLTAANTPGVFLPSGWLLWVQADTLVAQRLDVEQALLTGEPVTLATGVAAVSVAMTGLIAYRTSTASLRQLTWVDRSGTVQGTIGEADGTLTNPRVAPDGRRVVVGRSVQNNSDLWLLDGTRSSRLTFDDGSEGLALWSAEGTRIIFRASRTGRGDLYSKPANAAGVEELLLGSDQVKIASSWSTDGRFLLYVSVSPQTNGDIWVLPQDSDQTPWPFLQTPFEEVFATFSPDNRWVAFQSNLSGRNEIYVQPFIEPGAASSTTATTGQWQVSTAGGIMPLWSPDGSELYYVGPAGDMMAAPISATGTSFEPGTPVALFPAQIAGGGLDTQIGRQYDIAPDGRFLINRVIHASDAPITLIQNWNPEAAQ